MKTIVSALIALSVLAGVVAPANAFDAKTLYEQLDRQSYQRFANGTRWLPDGTGSYPDRPNQ